MSIITYPLNGITYDAEAVSTYLCTRTSGVYSKETNFAVSVSGTRELTVAPGLAWINYNDFRGVSVCSQESVALTVPDADSNLDRIDRVVLRFDVDANQSEIVLRQGTPADRPEPPAIVQNHRQYELGLCTVTVPVGSVTVSAANITDTRLDESVCGLMRDGVTSIPTEQLTAECQALLAQLQTQIRSKLTALQQSIDGVESGSFYTKSEADKLFTLTASGINTALGYDLAEKLTRLERMMNMDGKLVYTGTGIANNNTHTMTIPTGVDYIKVRMARPALESSNAGVGVCSDYGVTNIVRGGSAKAMVGNNSTGDIALMTFAADGTLTIGGTTHYDDCPFNVEGYQYL